MSQSIEITELAWTKVGESYGSDFIAEVARNATWF